MVNCTFLGGEGFALQVILLSFLIKEKSPPTAQKFFGLRDICVYPAPQVAGNGSLIENNLFAHNDWTGHTPSNGATLYTQAFSTNDKVVHNTLISNGKEAGIRLGDSPIIQLNEIVGQCEGRIANDGAAVQVNLGNFLLWLYNKLTR